MGGIVAGVVLTGLIWKVGFVASIAGYLMAMACVKLYELGAGGSRNAFVRGAITDPTVLKAYLSTFAMMAFFTALGIFSTLRNIMRNAATA